MRVTVEKLVPYGSQTWIGDVVAIIEEDGQVIGSKRFPRCQLDGVDADDVLRRLADDIQTPLDDEDTVRFTHAHITFKGKRNEV